MKRKSELQPWERAALVDRARFNVLAALIMSGWESLGMDVDEALRIADILSETDPFKASKISGYIAHGKEVPEELAIWARDARKNYVGKETLQDAVI